MWFKYILFVGAGFLLLSLVNAGCVVKSTPECYKDAASRTLGDTNVNTDGALLTLEYCSYLCSLKNKKLAGTENSSECYCGDSLNSPLPQKSNACSNNCSGNPDQICGGDWAVSVYSFTCDGTPEPAPKLPFRLVNPCLDSKKPFAAMPFCNATLSIEDRVSDAVSRMTMKEKINALSTDSAPIHSLGLNAYNWWSEASSGVATGGGVTTRTTKFAFPISTGMSFNRTMWQMTARHIGHEARAMMNDGTGFSTFWAPVINLAREPRWGRNIETPGEDPYLTGEYAEWFVRGFQEAPEDPYHLQASACCKHYVANELDSTTQPDGEHQDRNHVDTAVTKQDLVDSYMKPFQACVEKGRVSSLMCSYNSVNGVPSCANDWLLKTVARDNWGFDGYITSDCDADDDVFNAHHYTSTPEEAVRDVLRAGTDVDCGGFVSANAESALGKGLITMDDIDTRLKMLFRVRMRLSHFDPLGPLNTIPDSVICSDEGKSLSYEGVQQSAALLKNDGHSLPLSRKDVGTVAVIGPNSLLSKSDAGYYGPSIVCDDKFWTLVDAVSQGGAVKTVNTLGVPDVLSEDQSGIPAAVAMASNADTVILAVGTDLSWSAEGKDAASILFTKAQSALIERVSAASKKPVIVVLMTATPLDISAVLSNPKVGAVLHLGQPSVAVLGVGAILYGDRSPAGRTIQTIYPASYQDQISIFDFNMRPGPSTFARPDCTNSDPSKCPRGTNPGRTYRFYTGTPIVPFGFGLSYTTFSYAVVSAPSGVLSLNSLREKLAATYARGHTFLTAKDSESVMLTSMSSVAYAVNVTNTGVRDSDDVVLGFLTPPGAGQDGVPLRTLFGFQRVHVRAGETVTVWLYPSATDFALTNREGLMEATPGSYGVHFGVKETATHGMGYVVAPSLQAI